MKQRRFSIGILTVCLLFAFPSCDVIDNNAAPADQHTVGETASETKIETTALSETEEQPAPTVRYVYSFDSEYQETGKDIYQQLCDGPAEQKTTPSIWEAYEIALNLSSPLIYAKSGQVFSVPTCVLSEPSGGDQAEAAPDDFDITWYIAEPELLEVVSVDRSGVMSRQLGYVHTIPCFALPEAQTPGFAVRTPAPGTVHLYITVTHRESEISQVMQQIIVIEE